MIENILLTRLRLVGLDIYVFDPTGPVGNRLIYWHSATGKPAPGEAALSRESIGKARWNWLIRNGA